MIARDTEDLVVEDGKVSVVGTDRTLTFRQLARAVYLEMGRIPADKREELTSTKTYDPVFGTSATAAQPEVLKKPAKDKEG